MRKLIYSPMNRQLLVPFAVILAGANLTGQDRFDEQRTNGFPNGRFWEQRTDLGKGTYLLGFFDGLSAASSLAEQYITKEFDNVIHHLVDQGSLVKDSSPAATKPLPPGAETPQTIRKMIRGEFVAEKFTVRDYITELDKLYADRANILLPIPEAIRYCALKLRGELTNAELEQRLIQMRKDVAALEEKKP